MKKRSFVLAAVLTSIQLCTASHGQAQTDSSGKLLDEAIVTANKFEQKQSQTGKVVAVISREQLERSGGKTLSQVLNEQAGVVINGALNAPGTVQTIYMRGASSGRVIILLDGIPINDPSTINNEFDLNFISVHDIERIEIARGAQSTAYGSDAIAGAINIITVKKHINKPFNASLTAIAGSQGTYKAHTGVNGRINRFSYNAGFNFIHTDGFSSVHDSTGSQDFDNDGQEGDMFQARIQYDITDALKTYAWFSRSRYYADIDANAFIDEKDYFLSHTNRVAGIGMQYKKGKLDARTSYQYGLTRRQFRNDSGYISLTGIIFEKNHFEAASHFYELYGNYKINSWVNVLAGMDYRNGRMNQDYYALSFFGPFSTSFGDTSLNQLSGYASVFLSFLKNKLNLEAGARFNDHSRYGSNSTYTFNPSYNFTPHFRIFGSIASGFKAPSIYQLYDGFSGNPALSPEKSTNYEAGVSWNKEKFGIRVVYFHRDIANGLDFNYNTFKYFNFVEQSVSGLEFELRASPVKQWNIIANYSLITGEEKTQSRKSFNDTTYSHLLRRPKHNINISTGYHITPTLYASASLKYVSDRFDTGGFMADDIKLDGYALINAYAEYKWKPALKLFVDLQNITNQEFFDVRGFNGIPFMVQVGVVLRFDGK